MIGAFDTKGPEFHYLRGRLLEAGCDVSSMNVGVKGSTNLFPVEHEAAACAEAAGESIEVLRETADRGKAMEVMSRGAAAYVWRCHEAGAFDGIIGMGGSGGSSVIAAAMRALPLGIPKVLVSTVAGGDVSAYVGISDIVLIPAIVDVAGLNRISRMVIARAAGAMAGMLAAPLERSVLQRPVIAASMFGNTTTCVQRCVQLLEGRGYEVLVFHAVGTGGRTMEALVRDGMVDAVLDITTTEWADELCGGVFSAGPDRLSAPGERGIPHLIVPGCVDMVNFGPMESVPDRYRDGTRTFHAWNPAVTLMRTNVEENRRMGRIFAEKANAAKGPVAVLIPLRGVSILDGDGQPFCDRAADAALFSELKLHLRRDIPYVELDCNINDEAFSAKAAEMILMLIDQHAKRHMGSS
jgi:uncharacterized protein (UPF0261 family)